MKRSAEFHMRNIGGEKLLVPLGAQVRNLNGLIILSDTAAWMWELLAQELSLDDLAIAVTERFDVTGEIARADVLNFVNEIARMGLIEQ